MLGTFYRAAQVRKLESRKRKLELQRDAIIASMVNDKGTHLYRHEYPDTPVLEDVFLELDYLQDALASYDRPLRADAHAH